MLPTTVPYGIFRKTHLHHHAATNIPERDPDEFLNTRRAWQIPFRAFALPYHWVIWMWRNGQFPRRERVEYYLSYAVVALVYGTIAWSTGFSNSSGNSLRSRGQSKSGAAMYWTAC